MLNTRPRRAATAVALLLLFAGLYAASNLLPAGQAWENRLLRAHHADGFFPALLGREIPFPPFDSDVATLCCGTALAVLLAACRRRWRALVVALVATPASLLATQGFKHVFGRPDLIGAVLDTDVSYPSGHAAIAFAVTAALLLTLPTRWLRWAAPVLLAWSVLVAAALQSVGYHRPSEVLGTGLLVPAVFLLAGLILPPGGTRLAPAARSRALLVPAFAVVAVLGALNSLPWAIALYAGVALLSVAIVGSTALALRPPRSPVVRATPSSADAAPAPLPEASARTSVSEDGTHPVHRATRSDQVDVAHGRPGRSGLHEPGRADPSRSSPAGAARVAPWGRSCQISSGRPSEPAPTEPACRHDSREPHSTSAAPRSCGSASARAGSRACTGCRSRTGGRWS